MSIVENCQESDGKVVDIAKSVFTVPPQQE